MSSLCLMTVMQCPGEVSTEELSVDLAAGESQTWEIRLNEGRLAATPRNPDRTHANGDGLLAMLYARAGRGSREFYLLPRTPQLAVNALSPPLDLCRVEPGSLVSCDGRVWMVALKWVPEPREAPPELASKLCPVCCAELKIAPVVQCVCGRWTHLERPDDPLNTEYLNCYLAAETCSSCLLPSRLEPQIIPEPMEKLVWSGSGEWDF